MLPKFIIEVRFTHLTLFLALVLFIVTILLGSSNSNSKPSSSRFELDHLSFLAPYVLSYDQGEATSNNTKELAPYLLSYDQGEVASKNTKELAPYLLSYDQGEATSNNTSNVSDKVSYSLELAGVVYVDIEVDVSGCGNKDGFNIDECSFSDVDTDDFHGYDGYDEDNDDDCNEKDYGLDSDDEEEEDDDDLKRRAEEFIAKNIRKWKEEMLIDYKLDNMLCLAAEEWQFSV